MTTFLNIENFASSALASDHAVGDGLLRVAPGQGGKFGTTWPARVVCFHPTDGTYVIFKLAGRTSDTLEIGAAIEETRDIALPSGSVVSMRWTKGVKVDIEAAINAIDSAGPAGLDGQVQVRSGEAFAALAGQSSEGGLAVGPGTVAIGTGCLAIGYNCHAEAETGAVAFGYSCQSVDQGDGGCDWAFAMGSCNLSMSAASAVFGSSGVGDVQNKFVVAGGNFEGGDIVGSGHCQWSLIPLLGLSISSAPITLTTTGGGGPGNTITLPIVRDGGAYGFELTVVGHKPDNSQAAMFRRAGLVTRTGTAATLVFSEPVGTDSNAPGWSVDVSVANDSHSRPYIKVAVVGTANTRWIGVLRCCEVA